MLKIYIDESGDLGRNDGYFIIAMIICHNTVRMKNLTKSFCAYNKLPEIHASELNFIQKQYLINKLTKQDDYSVGYIVADKMKINNEKLFYSNNLLFNYLFSFLIKDTLKANTEDVYIHLDNRTQKVASQNSLQDYIKTKAFGEWGFSKNLEIKYLDSKSCKTIQIADLIASVVRRKYVHNTDDFYSKLNITKSIRFPYKTFRDAIYK